MKSLLSIILLSSIVLSHIPELCAKDYALVLAGGCDGSLMREMFEESFWFAETVKKKGWHVIVLHGDRADTEGMNFDYLKNSKKYDLSRYEVLDFTEKNIQASLKKIAKDIKKGDKLLVNIITHGLPVASVKGHIICLRDKPENFNVDRLRGMGLDSIYSKGAKIGILDNSCYGGESIATFDDIACVLSTQTPRLPSIATATWENIDYDDVFGVTSVVTRYLSKHKKSLSLEDYYLKALADYPSWSALKDPIILSVFPNMSGDDKGNALSDFASIYAFISSDDVGSMDLYNYYEEELCGDLVDVEKNNMGTKTGINSTKQSQTVSEAFPGHEQCMMELKNVSDEKYKLFQNIRYYFNLNKKSLKLKPKAVRNIRKELKELTDKIRSTYSEIEKKESLLEDKKADFLTSLEKFLKDNQIKIRSCVPQEEMKKLMAKSSANILPRAGGSPTYKDAYETLLTEGCSFFEESNEIECDCCEKDRFFYCNPYSFHASKDTGSSSYCLGFRTDIAELISDMNLFDRTECGNEEYRNKANKQIKLDQNPLLLQKSKDYASLFNQLLELKKKRSADIEKFNVAFNKFKAVRYIKETPKVNPNAKIKRCRDFKI